MLAPEGLGGGLRCGVGLYMDWVLMGLVGLLASTDLQAQEKNLKTQRNYFLNQVLVVSDMVLRVHTIFFSLL